jgi:hypothetical protein
MATPTESKLTGDFDFLVGSWDVRHRSLVELLAGSDVWRTAGNSTASAWTYFDGAVSIDEIALPDLGWSGMSLRLFSPETRDWSIWWLSSRDGRLGPPVHGRWVDGVGELAGDDRHDGTPVRVRYRWSEQTGETARWEQAYSADGERTWETNWVMDFSRTSEQPLDPPAGHLEKVTGDFDFLVGRWQVRRRALRERLKGSTEWIEAEHTLSGRTHLNGLVSVDENHFAALGSSGLTFRAYDVAAKEWVIHWIDSRYGRLGDAPLRGRFTGGDGLFYADDEWEGTPIRCRYLWTGITAGSARWEQAFSTDGGATWETNAIWELSRIA